MPAPIRLTEKALYVGAKCVRLESGADARGPGGRDMKLGIRKTLCLAGLLVLCLSLLGVVILARPSLLNSAAASLALLAAALAVTVIIALITRRISPDLTQNHS